MRLKAEDPSQKSFILLDLVDESILCMISVFAHQSFLKLDLLVKYVVQTEASDGTAFMSTG